MTKTNASIDYELRNLNIDMALWTDKYNKKHDKVDWKKREKARTNYFRKRLQYVGLLILKQKFPKVV